jgi:CheY-like chemotaxis protein
VRVLVVEDEQVLAQAVARGLRREGMAVDVALDGADALDKATVNRYEVLVLDRDLPVVHGDQVCRTLVARGGQGRILMLTAAGTVADRVEGRTWAPTTTWASRSRSASWSRGCGRWAGAASSRPRRCWPAATWWWTGPGARPAAAATFCR